MLVSILKQCSLKSIKVIDSSISLKEYVSIDLSSENLDLDGFDLSSSKLWETYVNQYLILKKAKVAFGGYLEKRALYDRSLYFNSENELDKRQFHLGVDLWVNSGTKVLAAIDGEIHSFNNNTNHGDYGPTIILKHNIESVEFYTLYGHLSLESISNLQIGQKVNKGQVIAHLGDSEINGDYAPHLHFQIIKNLQGFKGDYPGVSSLKDLSFYKDNCPNPLILLGLC